MEQLGMLAEIVAFRRGQEAETIQVRRLRFVARRIRRVDGWAHAEEDFVIRADPVDGHLVSQARFDRQDGVESGPDPTRAATRFRGLELPPSPGPAARMGHDPLLEERLANR